MSENLAELFLNSLTTSIQDTIGTLPHNYFRWGFSVMVDQMH